MAELRDAVIAIQFKTWRECLHPYPASAAVARGQAIWLVVLNNPRRKRAFMAMACAYPLHRQPAGPDTMPGLAESPRRGRLDGPGV